MRSPDTGVPHPVPENPVRVRRLDAMRDGRSTERTDPAGTEPWALEEVYDPETLALIDEAAEPGQRSAPPRGIGDARVPVARPLTSEPPAPLTDDDALELEAVGGAPGVIRRGRSGVAGLLMAGMMTGVAEVLDPDRLQPEMVEFTPDRPDPETMPVQFIHVVGDPAASRLIIRPWLFRH